MPKIVGGGYPALTTTAQTDDVLICVDIHDTTEDASGSTKTITFAELQAAIDSNIDTNIKADGAQASGTVGANADAGHVHPAGSWVPADNNLLAASFVPAACTSTTLTVAGNLYLQKIWIRAPFTAATLWAVCSTLGTGTSTGSFCGLWSSAGTLLTGSSDIGTTFNSGGSGVKSVSFTTAQALTVSMSFVWAGIVFNGLSPSPILKSANTNTASVLNANLTAANYATAINGTSVTSLTSITPSANSQGGNVTPYWIGIS